MACGLLDTVSKLNGLVQYYSVRLGVRLEIWLAPLSKWSRPSNPELSYQVVISY
jgi:hypothetical protein